MLTLTLFALALRSAAPTANLGPLQKPIDAIVSNYILDSKESCFSAHLVMRKTAAGSETIKIRASRNFITLTYRKEF